MEVQEKLMEVQEEPMKVHGEFAKTNIVMFHRPNYIT